VNKRAYLRKFEIRISKFDPPRPAATGASKAGGRWQGGNKSEYLKNKIQNKEIIIR